HLVENAFARLKHYRAVATRYDKLKRNYESMVAMACGYLWLPMVTYVKCQQTLGR
ncbi:MAG: transposase, partial [Nitrosomonas sp.]|nr:transposase [Nitrosomonas sp.]